jgi:hypothetical protein
MGGYQVIKNWGTRWNEIMRYGKPLEKAKSRPMLTTEQIGLVVYECEVAAYRTLSDSSVSKTTANMSEEGREVVARAIAEKLKIMLGQSEDG